MGTESKDLLFCDTFNHEGEEGQLHVDMVRFSPPVNVEEVRVVPRAVKAHSEGTKLGFTQPSSFALDVYINDSQNPLAPTFDPLGVIEYNPETISLETEPKNSSDLLVVRGLYTVLTLSVYGTATTPPQPPSPPPGLRAASPHSNSDGGFSAEGERKEALDNGDAGDAKGFELYETFSPVNSPDHLFDLSDEETLPTKRSTAASGGYEELSDEEVSFDGDFDAQEGEDSYYGEDGWLTSGVGFNPYQCEFSQLESYGVSTDTPHEVLLAKLQKSDAGFKRGGTDEVSKLRDIILKQRDQNQLKWVEMVEEIPSYLYPGLAQLHKKSSADAKEVMQKLVSWTRQCLDLETAQQSSPFSVRHLKAGMRLVSSIARLGRKCASALIKHDVMERLCDLLMAENMSSTLKLLSLRALDGLLNYPQGVERFLGWDKGGEDDGGDELVRITLYQQVLDLQLSNPSPRICSSVTALLSKVRVAELLGNLQQSVEIVIAVTPVKPATASGDVYSRERVESECTDGGSVSEQLKPEEGELNPDLADSAATEDLVLAGNGASVEGVMEVREEGEGGGREEEEEGEEPIKPDNVPIYPEEEVTKVVRYLQDLKKCLEHARHTTVQPPIKNFPTSIRASCDPEEEFFPPLVRVMQARRMFHSLFILLTSPSTSNIPQVFQAARDLLLFLLASQEGTILLSSCPAVMTALTRTLVPPNMEELSPMDEEDMLTYSDLLGEEDDEDEHSSDSCTPQNLGLLLTYHLQVLQALDSLRKASKLNMSELESAECIGALHNLYSMTLAPIGKCAISHVLSLSDNVLALLPFIEPRQQRDHDTKLTKSSVSSRYAAVLLLTLLKSSVRFDFLFDCGSKLLSAAEFFKDNSSPLMSDLYNWLSPVKELTSGNSTKVIPALVALIKEKIPSISCNRPGKACSPIMTSIRILLCYVTPAPSSEGARKDPKLIQNILHLFSCNCLDTLTSFLSKFADIMVPLWSQRQSLSVSNASTLVSLATVALKLVKVLMRQLLDGVDYQFRDTRVAEVLLRVHMVLCSAPYFTVAINAAHQIQMLIVQILVMYSKPVDIIKEGEDAPDLSQNCWCLMLKAVFEHTLSSPHCFLSGLMVLSELLPLPLPTHSAHPVSSATLSYHRKLWGLHLDPFLPNVTEVLQTFLLSSPNALQQILRRVCAQLADINPSLANLITQQVISSILVEIEKQLEKEEPEPMSVERGVADEEGGGVAKEEKGSTEEQSADKAGEDEQIRKAPNSPLLRVLTTCAVLCQQNAIKVALLNLISKKETAGTKGFSRFIPLLLFLVQRKETMVQHKLCVMTILNAVCNMYIGLTTSEQEDMPPSEQQLSNCLPGKVKLETITSAVLSHVTSPDQPMATMMLGLKVILSLCQYDIGLLNIYRLIPTHVRGFAYILERLTEAVRSPSPPPDTISCVSLFLQLLGHLLSSEVTGRAELFDEGELRPSPREEGLGGEKADAFDEGELQPSPEEESSSDSSEKKRESHYEIQSVGFPRPLLKMIVFSDAGESLLGNLRAALEMNCKEDTSLFTEFTKIIATLEQEFEGVEPAFVAPSQLEHRSWPAIQNLETQFELRNVVSLSVSPPSPDYWISSPPHDETELEPDTVTVDLTKLASSACSGLNLEEELKKQLLPSLPNTPPRNDRKRKIALTGPEAQKRLKEAIQQRMLHGPKRDLFRLRKQNTSRPPSMHVDDFMASKSSSGRNSRGALSHDHGLGRAPGGGRGSPFPYMSQPGMFMPSMGGGRWLGAMAPGMHYPARRDVMSGPMRSSWGDARGIPSAFLSANQLKSSALSRNVSMYSALQAYSRASSSGRGPILWPTSSSRSSSSLSSSRQSDSGHKSSSSSSRHSIYQRLV